MGCLASISQDKASRAGEREVSGRLSLCLALWLALAALCTLSLGEVLGAGRIVANADDWTTEDRHFTASAETFTANVFQWLTQSAPNPTILVDDQFDQHPATSYNRMLNALTTHGFTVVRAKTSTWTSAFLADFDAVLVQFGSIDATMLTSYVHNGGGVYIVGGSGGTPIVNYNPFLAHFGLSFAFPPVDRSGNITNFVPHPVTRGVTQLYVAGPTPITITAPGPVILSTQFGVNWLAVVETFVGGSVTGISPQKGMVVCLNLTTGGRAVRIPLDRATSWNCEDAGLVVNPGDKIQMLLHVTGTAN